MKYEDFCKMVKRTGDIYEDLDGTKFLVVECAGTGFFFNINTHDYIFFTNSY